MPTTDREIDECLAALIAATADAEASFHAAAGDVRSEEARVLLLDRAQRYGRAGAGMRGIVAGGARAREAGVGREVTRLGPADDVHILGECERRECAVIVLFRDALDRDLPLSVRAILALEFETLLASIGSLATARERADRQRRLVVGEPT